jgi:hypothetical protein
VSGDAAAAAMLEQRYGRRSTSPVAVAVGIVVAVVVGGLLGWIAWVNANPPVRYKLLTYQAAGDHAVDITWEVRRSATDAVTCVLRAQDETHVDIGYAYVTLGVDGTDYVQPTYRLTTLSPAYSADVIDCGVGAEPPRTVPPQFRPGTSPPPQQPPGRAP